MSLLQTIKRVNFLGAVDTAKFVVRGVPGTIGPPGDPTNPATYFRLNTTAGEPSPTYQGQFWWDADEETITLRQNGTMLQFGQEMQWNVRNNSGSIITDGTVVMATGSIGASGRITVAPMDGTDPDNSSILLGIATEDIANSGDGKVSTFGKVRDIDTSGQDSETWADGDILYVSTTIAGGLTNVAPTGSDLKMPVAFVVFANPTTGTLAVRVTPINENIWVKRVGGSVLGAYEPIKANGTVTGTYAFDYVDGNAHSVTFTAVDCALSWDNLPAAGNLGSVWLEVTTGAALPSTLGGSATPDWQVELLGALSINDTQTFELWVRDGATVRIQESTYLGQ